MSAQATSRADAGEAIPADGESPSRGRLRRALRVEIALQRDAFVGSSIFATMVLAITLPGFARLGGILLGLALWAPYMFAMGDVPERRAMRAALGISRADRVRARTVLVVMLQAALSAVVVLVLLFGPPRVPDAGGELPMMAWHAVVTGISLPVPTSALWSDVLTWLPALVITHIWVGREALRRAGAWVLVASAGTFLLAYGVMSLLPSLLIFLAPGLLEQVLLRGVDGELIGGGWITFEGLQALAGGAVLLLALVVLVWRSRTWARRA
ncbi:hypothetical protein Bequi_06380 [Brachybacterium sp. JHP9]|uniref:ABC transporter permease n=1 Tax=Brachybacterium equifaecis TaxID=2910770 RepID=A0ABT0R0Q2_9MICO|nr:hypothetical protein [Brachybacterium equifaecis]MCL6423018.1 hypothetical protein [Brachybacterium equifaecis]